MRAVVFALALLFASPLHAQRVVFLTNPVRATLAKEWDRTSKDAKQHERAFCVRYDVVPFAGETAYRVYAIQKAIMFASSADAIVYGCPVGEKRADLHVHPPTTCASDTACVFGGAEAYECFPSDIDRRTLTASTEPFGLIQCDRKAVVFYFPDSN